jgi:hypothetical protein
MSPTAKESIQIVEHRLDDQINKRLKNYDEQIVDALIRQDYDVISKVVEDMKRLKGGTDRLNKLISGINDVISEFGLNDNIPEKEFADVIGTQMAVATIRESLETGETPRKVISEQVGYLMRVIAIDEKGNFKFNTNEAIITDIFSQSGKSLNNLSSDARKRTFYNFSQAKGQVARMLREDEMKGMQTVAEAMSFHIRTAHKGSEVPKFYRAAADIWGKEKISKFNEEVLNRFRSGPRETGKTVDPEMSRYMREKSLKVLDRGGKKTPELKKGTNIEKVLNSPATEIKLACKIKDENVRLAITARFFPEKDLTQITKEFGWKPNYPDLDQELDSSRGIASDRRQNRLITISESEVINKLIRDSFFEISKNPGYWQKVMSNTDYSAWNYVLAVVRAIAEKQQVAEVPLHDIQDLTDILLTGKNITVDEQDYVVKC